MMGRHDDLLFDEQDLQEDRNYCKHGTFIGNPFGGDYMCGWCEDGVSDEEYAAWCKRQQMQNWGWKVANRYFEAVGALNVEPGSTDGFASIIAGITLGFYRLGQGKVA